jgi:catechol 2,3-dioxygenase-like lactoylglutathione lyase family enzyme
MPSDTSTASAGTTRSVNLGKLTNTLVQCLELDRSRAFYTDTLGLTVQAGGDGWAVLDGGSGTLVLVEAAEREVVIAFTGADLDAARTAMEQRGAEPTERRAHPGGEHFMVTDPEGNRVMIST